MKKKPSGTKRPGNVPWKSPKSRNVQDLQVTFRGLLGKQNKKLMIQWEKCFLDAIVLVLQIYFCFHCF